VAGKSYNAGTIFLQVVPVFGDVQRAIERKAKDINDALGDEMEKGGEEAGKRASAAMNEELEKGAKKGGKESATEFQKEFDKAVKGMSSSLKPIDLRVETDEVQREVTKLREMLETLSKIKIKTEVDAENAERVIRALEKRFDDLREHGQLQYKLDFDQANKSANTFAKRLDNLRKAASVEVELDTKPAERAMGHFEKKMRDTARKAGAALSGSLRPEIQEIKRELDSIADADIGVDMDASDARAKIDDLQTRLRRLQLNDPEIDVKVNAGRAYAEIVALTAVINAVDGRDIDIKADVDAGAAAAKMGMLRTLFMGGAGSDAAANSFRSFNAVVLATAALLPALIPVVGALGGALLGLVPILASVGAGFGAMLVGFSGIGDAVTALGDHADDAAKDTAAAGKTMAAASYAVADARQALADAERNAARASADAARAVADARRSASEAIEDALDRQREAQEAYRDSVQDVKDAEADLREARKRAAEEDRAATHDLRDQARQNKLDIREAILGAFDATNTFNAVMADGSSTTRDQEGAEVAMLQARERLHELRDLEKQIARDRKQARKDGTNPDVESAQDALTAALERQRDAQEAVGEAAENVREARVDGARQIADAVRNQQRAEADGQRAIARAQEQLRRAQEAYGQALYDTGELGSASMQKLEEAMGKLGPAGRKFARFLFSLRDDFYRFRDAVQATMLPPIQKAMEGLINRYGPQFTAFMAKMGGVVGQFFLNLSKSLRGPAWSGFFGVMEKLGPKMAAQFGQSTINWLETFANIMTIVAPFAERMSRAMLRISEAVKRWSASKRGDDAVTGFMEYAQRVGPMVMDFMGAFVRAVIKISKAMAPWGEMVLKGLTGLLDWIAGLDTKKLGMFLGVVTALAIAFMVTVGVIALVAGGMTVFATTAGAVLFSVIAVVGVLLALGMRYEWIGDTLKWIGDLLWEHKGTIMAVVVSILGAIAILKIWRAVQTAAALASIGHATAVAGSGSAIKKHGFITKASYVATKIWTAVTWAASMAARGMAFAMQMLNMAFRANPIGFIITVIMLIIAAFVLAYKKIDWFREGVNYIIGKVVDGFEYLWDVLFGHSIIPDIVDGFMWAVDQIGRFLGWVVDWVVPRVVKGFRALWKSVGPSIKNIARVAGQLWDNFVRGWKIAWPVIRTIIKVIFELWKFHFKVYFALIAFALRTTFNTFKWIWDHILKPTINAIVFAIKFLKERFDDRMESMREKWRTVMGVLEAVWKTVLKPVWDAMRDGLDTLRDNFRTSVDNIGEIWDNLRSKIGRPIRFVIEEVLNDGLIDGFNRVSEFVKGPQLKHIPVPEWTYATGGILPGYTPGRDVHEFYSPTAGKLNLSGGEAILRPEATMALGSGFIDGVNRAARFGGARAVQRALGYAKGGVVQGFAKGGVVFPVPGGYVNRSSYNLSHNGMDINHPNDASGNVPFVSATSGKVTTTGYARGYGNAVFVMSPYGELVYGHALDGSVRVRPDQSVVPGQWLANIGNTGNSTGPHLHFGKSSGGSFGAMEAILAGAAHVTDIVKTAKQSVKDRFPGWLIDLAKNPLGYVKGLVSGPIDRLRDQFGGSKMMDVITGVPGRLYEAAKDKIWSWVPGPVKSFVGGLGEVADKVGDVVGAIVPGGGGSGGEGGEGEYRHGGILPYNGTMKYDAGGYLPPGLTNVVNLTGKPEPVLTDDQFDDFGGKGGGFTYAPTITEANLTSEELLDDVEFTARKWDRRPSRYEGAQS
jgi:hypothetical protein